MRVARVKKIDSFIRPDSEAWGAHTPLAVKLTQAPVSMQPTEYIRVKWEDGDYGKTSAIGLSAVHDGESLAIRLEWECAEKHPKDGIAVAMPIKGRPPLLTMGAPGSPIQYLHWIAEKDIARSTVAEGIGESEPGADFKRHVSAEWDSSHWQVVFVRPLGQGEGIAPVEAGQKTGAGFAVWQGSNNERAGLKSISFDWTELMLDA